MVKIKSKTATFEELENHFLKQNVKDEYRQAAIIMLRNAFVNLTISKSLKNIPTNETKIGLIVSDEFFNHLELLLEHHKKREAEKAKYKNYNQALYYSHRAEIIEELILKIKKNL